ncbi:uncharacterized protein [Dermacentor albipictus]|uniref:uncharacterized protein isoform X2 n=1 Tax=Dermacentor albipictus TaxID=60249 RepID=UPI0038FCCE66
MPGYGTPPRRQALAKDEERAPGSDQGKRHVELDTQRPHHSHSHQPPATPMSVVEEQWKECRSLSHLGIFMPLYLLPLLFFGPKYGGCLYCLLLPLLLWAFNSLPKPVTSLVHLVTVPLLGLMDTERVAHKYLAADVLTMVPLLFLVVVMDRWSDVVLATAQGMCARFGLRRGPLFAGACACSFACSWVFSSAVASAALLYFLDRVLTTTFRENMDQAQDGGALWSPPPRRRSSQQDSASMAARPPHEEDHVLFERLTQLVLSTQKPKSPTRHFKREREADEVSNLSQPTDGATTTVTIDETSGKLPSTHSNEDVQRIDASSSHKADNKRKAPFRLWRLGWYKWNKPPAKPKGRREALTQTAASMDAALSTDPRECLGHVAKQGESAPADSMPTSAAPVGQASASQADKVPQSRKGPFGIATPFAAVRKRRQLRRLKKQQQQQQQQQEQRQPQKQEPPQRPQQLPSSNPTFAESKTDAEIPVQSTMATSKTTAEPLRLSHDQHESSNKQRDDSHLDRHPNTPTGATSQHPSSQSRFQWLRKFSVFGGTSGPKRIAEEKSKEGNAPRAASKMRETHPTHQRPADRENEGSSLSWTELSECRLSSRERYASVSSSRAPATKREDDNVKEVGRVFVFDALAEHLDFARKAFITAAAGVVNELGVPIPGAESEISITPEASILSPAVQGSGCATAPNSVTPMDGAVLFSLDRATALDVPTHALKTDERDEKKEAQGDEASDKTHLKKRSRKNRHGREKKKQQTCRSSASSSKSSGRSSERSSRSQTPRASNKINLQGKRNAPVFVSFREEEQHDLKGSEANPDGSSSDGKGREAKAYEGVDFAATTERRRHEGPSARLVEPNACEITDINAQEARWPPAREAPEVPEQFLVQLEARKVSLAIAASASARDAEQGGQHGSLERESLHKGSQLSKSSLKKSRGSDHPKSKLGDTGAKKAAVKMSKTGHERRTKRKPADHHLGSPRPTPEPTVDDEDRAEEQRKGIFATAVSASMPELVEESQSSKAAETPKPAAVAVVADRDDSKSAAGATSTVLQPQNALTEQQESTPSTVSGLLKRSPAVPLAASSAPRQRLQSVVSFGEDVKEISKEESSTTEKLTPLSHLFERAPRLAPKRGLSTILRVPGSGTGSARPGSSVDFGPTQCAVISPAEQHPGATMPRLLQSRLSTGSHSSTADSEALLRPPISLRQRMDNRSAPLHEMSSMRSASSGLISLLDSRLGSQLALPTRSSKTKRTEVTEQPITSVKWAIVTLPGVLLALVACSTAVWLLYVRPHEPAPMASENLAVIRAAQQKRARRSKQRGLRYACAAYVAIFSFVYALSLVLGLTDRMALLTALTSMMLVTSLLTSFLQAAFDFVRHIWRMMPWGVLLLLGATHVASELLQAYALPQEALRVESTSFWEERSPVEAQAMLAFATSVMAETADKRVLVEIMTPAVVHVAEIQRKYPAYYAIPVIVGASSNFIMPASMPLALLHEMARVQFWKLFLLGLFAKIIVMAMVIVTVNAADRAGLFGTQTSPE